MAEIENNVGLFTKEDQLYTIGKFKDVLDEQYVDRNTFNQSIGQIAGVGFLKVDQLPETGVPGIIYVVPVDIHADDDVCEEYIWIDQWEKLNAPVDLTGYAKTSELSKYALASSLDNYATKTDIEGFLPSSEVREITNDEIDEIFASVFGE